MPGAAFVVGHFQVVSATLGGNELGHCAADAAQRGPIEEPLVAHDAGDVGQAKGIGQAAGIAPIGHQRNIGASEDFQWCALGAAAKGVGSRERVDARHAGGHSRAS